VKELLTSFDWDPNSCVLLGVFDCHGVSCGAGAGGVRSRTSRRSKTTCALIGTKPDALKAFRQLTSVNTSKNASLKAGRKPSLLIWKTRRRAKSLTR
jgi:hypothetical protein